MRKSCAVGSEAARLRGAVSVRVTSGGQVADHQLLRVDRGEAASTAESLMDALPAIGRSAQFRDKNSLLAGLLACRDELLFVGCL